MPAGLDLVVPLLLGLGITWLWRREAARHLGHELRHPRVLLLIAAGALPFLWLALRAASQANPTWNEVGLPLAFASIGAYLVLEFVTVRYVVTPDGFAYRTLAAGSGFASWADIRRVRWSILGSWFRLELRSGRVVRVSLLIVGLPILARTLLEQCGPAIDPLARPALEQAAAGRPPVSLG